MIGGLLKSTSSFAIIAAAGMFIGGLALTPAMAADLGGDCCADLEERVADLEATTARKGNRRVSLTISGHVARSVGWYEDINGDSEFYSAGHGPSGSRVQFAGSAKLSANWTASYTLRLRMNGDRTSDVLTFAGQSGGPDAGVPGGAGRSPGVTIDRNVVALTHSQIGTFAFGQTGAPTDGVSNISLGGRGVTGDSAGTDWNRSSIQGFDLEQGTHQAIAYISPTIAGFTLAVAWADLDIRTSATPLSDNSAVDAWDIALRYANEFGPIRIAAGIGYTVADNDDLGDGAAVMGSVAMMHTPTGLNIALAAGTEIDGGLPGGLTQGSNVDDSQFWHVSGGINQNFFGVGNTSLYGEYGNYDSDFDNGGLESTVTMWGLGIVQNFDSAATELFLAYRTWEDDEDNAGDDDVSQILAGVRIRF